MMVGFVVRSSPKYLLLIRFSSFYVCPNRFAKGTIKNKIHIAFSHIHSFGSLL